MDIKEIHCFGTSFTAGGGFEWDINADRLRKYYVERPFTQYNYSWPGQLERIINPDIRVFNHAKNGYGNDRLMRVAWDIIRKSESLDDKLFLFEFSWMRRLEFWSNTFDTHIVTNYDFNPDESIKINGIADRWFSENIGKIENTLRPVIEPFLKETLKFEIEAQRLSMRMDFFVDYLLYNNINFKIVFYNGGYSDWDRIRPYTLLLNPDGTSYFPEFMGNNKKWKNISEETHGEIEDWHGGFEWSKMIAKSVADELNLYEPDLKTKLHLI